MIIGHHILVRITNSFRELPQGCRSIFQMTKLSPVVNSSVQLIKHITKCRIDLVADLSKYYSPFSCVLVHGNHVIMRDVDPFRKIEGHSMV